LSEQAIQLAVFCFVLGAIALITYIKCRGENRHSTDSNKEYFLAGGGLTWVFVAGSITLTNLSTDQLVGMNGNQILTAALFPIFLHADRRNGTESFEEAYKHIVVIGKMRGQLYKESERLLYETQ